MNIFQTPCQAAGPRLHVFEQEGGWHWGITIERSAGGGFKVIAYSEQTFRGADEAQDDGDRALVNLSELS
ncbi:hypothetical protein [Paraburkholderia acidisoli]|jgi:hypothetical protein|uniref:DUF1508 domain-containing protein n=1 Tax=Paraburkholderia acidisoli TaxID=2571748 RepID=A0A7Z2JK64_9BURK|nr:hypothetical protein [Paraburkholderia acidisoli]QGZ65994.1 hypothetical protein FAZ98_29690 [Paraburkholderia acidisoli]